MRGPRLAAGVVGASGLVALAALAFPFFRLDLGPGRTWTIGASDLARGIAGNDPRMGRLLDTFVADSAGAGLVAGVAVVCWLMVGPPLFGYFGLRYALGAFLGGRYHYLTAGVVVLAYIVAGWLGLGAWSELTGVRLDLAHLAGAGFWIASISLLCGSIIREVTHG